MIPAYNAAATITRTLTSALGQTYPHLEVIVVDDGSVDDTASIVEEIARRDPRVVLLRQANQGVAAARNLGIAHASGEYLATLDADDLWLPTKIARQVERLDAASSRTAIVYCWSMWIDDAERVLGFARPRRAEGEVLADVSLCDLITNCSTALVRTSVLRELGGFDTSLREQSAQGCEDWQLYMRIAERYEFALVPAYLVQYRRRADTMSEDFRQMMRSHELAAAPFRRRHPECRGQLLTGKHRLARSLARRAARKRRFGTVLQLLAGYPRPSLPFALRSAAYVARSVPKAIGRSAPGSLDLLKPLVEPEPINHLPHALEPQGTSHPYKDKLVSVIVPAYNAAQWLDETLRSVRGQTHRALEIIVVDDGSTDGTPAIARTHAAKDTRVRLLQQANAGVAVARNAGWQQATSDLIAFVDADDLWRPTKIEMQLAALFASPADTGLVYCWYDSIDADSRITDRKVRPRYRGRVLDHLMLGNFVGNGSAPLVRREALVHANGFDSGLRAQGAEGCEDIVFYASVAECFGFAIVEAPLVGYRRLPDAMSGNLHRMLNSWLVMVAELEKRHSTKHALIRRGAYNYAWYLSRRAALQSRPADVLPIVRTLTKYDAWLGIRLATIGMAAIALVLVKRRLFGASPKPQGSTPVGFERPNQLDLPDQRFRIGATSS